jgi:hypothetical protein
LVRLKYLLIDFGIESPFQFFPIIKLTEK